jgi:hypothetical protein
VLCEARWLLLPLRSLALHDPLPLSAHLEHTRPGALQQDMVLSKSLAREDTNHTLSKKSKK